MVATDPPSPYRTMTHGIATKWPLCGISKTAILTPPPRAGRLWVRREIVASKYTYFHPQDSSYYPLFNSPRWQESAHDRCGWRGRSHEDGSVSQGPPGQAQAQEGHCSGQWEGGGWEQNCPIWVMGEIIALFGMLICINWLSCKFFTPPPPVRCSRAAPHPPSSRVKQNNCRPFTMGGGGGKC